MSDANRDEIKRLLDDAGGDRQKASEKLRDAGYGSLADKIGKG